MLDDAHKPLRSGAARRARTVRPASLTVDLRMKQAALGSRGERLVNARDKTSVYALTQDPNMTEQERQQMRQQLKERFTPGARPMPTSIRGLAALANERIEDAIARGQFKNLPRGKGRNIERDYNANSPFLDTTEYFMNKIIQKQDIVPPWIEKQQELVKEAAAFRSRLRNDWKRHAARMIASKGGSLEAQVQRAEAYAAAEAQVNPRTAKVEAVNAISDDGQLSEVTIAEEPGSADGFVDGLITVNEAPPSSTSPSTSTSTSSNSDPISRPLSTSTSPHNPSLPPSPPPVGPFRDPDWERLELPYHRLALVAINSLTRSYNLVAPALAQKAYLGHARELRACYADVAPLLPDEIRARARAPVRRGDHGSADDRASGVWQRLGGGGNVKVWEDRRKTYGLRELWRDLFRW